MIMSSGGENALEAQLASLLRDRSKMNQALEMMMREGRAVSKEIHRLLDVLGELLPSETILASDFDSDESGYSETDEDDCIDKQRETAIVADLKHKYEQAKAKLQRMREKSPTRRSNDVQKRRSHRSLPMNEDGAIELPLVLGRGLNRISISRMGEIRDHPSFLAAGYVFPCGYECRRKWLAPDATGEDLSPQSRRTPYLVTIEADAAGVALFTLAALDAQETERLLEVSSGSLADLWEQFKGKCSEEVVGCLEQDFKSPEDFFGFDHENLRLYLCDQLKSK